jgi:hypothetical protein
MEAVEALFGHVLALQERLAAAEADNAGLRHQLKQQKALMVQMQAALLEQVCACVCVCVCVCACACVCVCVTS